INFYFLGNRNINEVAKEHNLNEQGLMDEIEAVQRLKNEDNIDFLSWPLDLLVDYIEKKHHRYIKKNAMVVRGHLENLYKTNGKKHPELLAVSEQFNHCVGEFSHHMKNEEMFLFPAVRKMVLAQHAGVKLTRNHFGSLQNPIQKMVTGHKTESERFGHIVSITNIYTLPVGACDIYAIAYTSLQEFENDLQTHIHLENNILFPKIKTLEKQLKHEL